MVKHLNFQKIGMHIIVLKNNIQQKISTSHTKIKCNRDRKQQISLLL